MVGIGMLLVCPLVLYLCLQFGTKDSRIRVVLWATFLFRVFFQFAAQNIAFFSHVARGDSVLYETIAGVVSLSWERTGVHFTTNLELPIIGNAALAINVFALLDYVNGGTSTLGCTMIVVLLATLCGLLLYNLARDLGCPERPSLICAIVFVFSPGFVYYTSDCYKDGFVAFFTLLSLSNAVRLSWKLSVVRVAVAFLSALALWYVRPYLVFATLIPLLVGLLGFNDDVSFKKALIASMALGFILALPATWELIGETSGAAENLFNIGTSARVRRSNSHNGESTVTFDDDGSAYEALHVKLIYTLFSPFPWMGGSFGLHIGKIDALVNVYFFWRSLVAIRKHWKTSRGTILTLLSFIIPMTVVYAFGMGNIGLILRQRMPISAMIILLGTLSWMPLRNVNPAVAQVPAASTWVELRAMRQRAVELRRKRNARPSTT